MNKSNSNLKFKETKLPVLGAAVKEGQKLPEATLSGADLSDVPLSKFAGKVLVLSVVPSLDTPVCSVQTKRFNQEASALKDVNIVTVSMDLPFAQKRWCGAEGVQNLTLLSDYKNRSFGEAFGCYIQTLGLLARSIFIADKSGTVRHVEYVEELSSEPDYAAAIAKVKELA